MSSTASRSTAGFSGRGKTSEEVIYAEKVREDALRDLGWQVVRWLWRDLNRNGVLRDRVRRAFARSNSSSR